MQYFRIHVRGDDLERATRILNHADIPTIGTTQARRMPPTELWHLERLIAVVRAATPEEAAARVRDALTGYTIGEPEPDD